MNHNSPRDISGLLEELGAGLKKRWGQNFLISGDVRTRIIDLLDIEPGAAVWEIGPGLGSMTEELLERGAHLTAFEIDWAFVRFLGDTLGARFEHFNVVQGDAAKTLIEVQAEHGNPDYVLGNLPYSVASAIIAVLLENGISAKRMVVMVQRELANRMVAGPGTKDYSAFSVLCGTRARMRKVFDVTPGCFYPAPEVVSSVVEILPGTEHEIRDPVLLSRLVRELFSSRRKTIRNNLKGSGLAAEYGLERLLDAFETTSIDTSVRAEALSTQDFVRVANALA
ncbi:MAG: ribosomal RNA small subunit methyltransferase A [Spirochaetaceae bacterium]|nr:MAG: ribosomal RNA small subunit methyltransferase A [Spirochaetaceae bacterium]